MSSSSTIPTPVADLASSSQTTPNSSVPPSPTFLPRTVPEDDAESSRSASPVSTPGSSRPPSPLLRPLSGLPSGGVARSKSLKENPRKTPIARRGSSPAMAPFLAQFEPMSLETTGRKEKVAVIGSGSWGTALARIAAINATEKEGFDEEVRMWVREREIPGKGLLTELINSEHENSRYLPNIELPENLVAVPNLKDVVKGATLILFCVPHQFLGPVVAELKQPGVLTPGARAISAIKGIEVAGTDIYTYPALIEAKLGLPCSALGGANIALEVASSQFCETTIGTPGPTDSALWHAVFDTQMFRVHCTTDVAGVSLSGALKNVVAIAAGFVDGLGLGGNTKAAILRIGLIEMATFTNEFFPSSSPETFSHHSAGMADLITTSFGGRNRKVAEAFVKTGKSFSVLEEELLNGQKLQGTVTSEEIFHFLEGRGRLDGYPLFEKVYRIAFEGLDVNELFTDL